METPEPINAIPMFRIFDVAMARAFYLDWLGFDVAFEHRYKSDLPLYMGVTLGAFELHLTEHHGDCSPGAHAMVRVRSLRPWHKALIGSKYAYNRPGLETQEWGLTMTVCDPFYNKITFHETP